MSIQTICVMVTCLITVGGVLIYIGKSLQTLKQFSEDRKTLFELVGKQGCEIARIDKELTQVKTRQEDCDSCP
ncbi:MAG: hypothetical protein FD174_2568 [Geobacteraceae bacterium]|nr:MAG: hypothetical protein FD174_2568 [Geobacteraceae bacterium]